MNLDTSPQPHVNSARFALAVVPAACLPFVSSLCYFVFFTESRFVQTLYGVTKIFILLWPIFATTLILRRRLPRRRLNVGAHLRALPLGALAGLVIALGILAVAKWPLAPLVAAGAPSIREKVARFGIEEHFVVFALGLSIAHSLLEEYAWRWFVYQRLAERFPSAAAHVLAAVAFAAHHVVVASQFFGAGWGVVLGAAVGVGGAIFSWLYQRQGTLVGAWVAHMMADLAIMAVGYQVLAG